MAYLIMKCWPNLTGSKVLEVSFLRRRGKSRSTESVTGYFWQIDGWDYQGYLSIGLDYIFCPAGNADAMIAFLKREKYGDDFGEAIVRDHLSLDRFHDIYNTHAEPREQRI